MEPQFLNSKFSIRWDHYSCLKIISGLLYVSFRVFRVIQSLQLHIWHYMRRYSSVKVIFKGWVTYFRDHQQINFVMHNGCYPSTKPPTYPCSNRQVKSDGIRNKVKWEIHDPFTLFLKCSKKSSLFGKSVTFFSQ